MPEGIAQQVLFLSEVRIPLASPSGLDCLLQGWGTEHRARVQWPEGAPLWGHTAWLHVLVPMFTSCVI